jgi:hypothetical protein
VPSDFKGLFGKYIKTQVNPKKATYAGKIPCNDGYQKVSESLIVLITTSGSFSELVVLPIHPQGFKKNNSNSNTVATVRANAHRVSVVDLVRSASFWPIKIRIYFNPMYR